jgi:hypothetical protein
MLKVLDFFDCDAITDHGIKYIFRLIVLEKLNITIGKT